MNIKKYYLITLILYLSFSIVSYVHANEKSSWYIGFGFGYGDGELHYPNSDLTLDDYTQVSDNNMRLSINFAAGGIINQNFHLGIDFSAIRQQASRDDISEVIQINNFLFALTFFPSSEGFLLKTGAGFSAALSELTIKGNGTDIEIYRGYAILGGLGYAFWLGDSFNLCINFEYSYQGYTDDSGPDNSHFWNAYVSFYWF